jgi:hypothetical protein
MLTSFLGQLGVASITGALWLLPDWVLKWISVRDALKGNDREPPQLPPPD